MVGKKTDTEAITYDRDRVILYALGIGAGVEKELDFAYEKNLKVFPTFATIPIPQGYVPLFIQLNVNPFTILHGEHKIVLHKEIPPEGTIYVSASIDSIYDKGDRGAHINIRFVATEENGELIYESKMLLVDRSAGNFGGERGPKKESISPPEGKKPDFRVAYNTSPDLCALYRLSGDKTLFHIDPEVAKQSGFGRPFLMGLCTYGHAGRAILHSVCDSNPARLRSFSTRFVNVVYPGDTLITSGWKVEEGKYIIITTNQDEKLVLSNAFATVSP